MNGRLRQLKKLINRVVLELSSLGLSPTVLQELITDSEAGTSKDGDSGSDETAQSDSSTEGPRIVYELVEHLDRIEPHLKLWVDGPQVEGSTDTDAGSPDEGPEEEGGSSREMKPTTNVLWSLHQKLQERQTVDPGSESPEISPVSSPGVDVDEVTE